MADSFYKLLEVDSSASQEAITASYKRLHAKFSQQMSDGEEDAINQLIALREAFGTLSDTQRRQRYDQRLADREVDLGDSTVQSWEYLKLLIAVLVIGVCGLVYAKHQSEQEKAHLERERVIAEVKRVEVEAQKQREEKQAADEAEQQRRRDENYERFVRERDRAYGSMVSRNFDSAEAQARAKQQRDELQRQREEQQRINEANQQLAREKALLRQLEAANSGYSR